MSAPLSPAGASPLLPELNSPQTVQQPPSPLALCRQSLREPTARASQGPGPRVEARAQSLYLD